MCISVSSSLHPAAQAGSELYKDKFNFHPPSLMLSEQHNHGSHLATAKMENSLAQLPLPVETLQNNNKVGF